MRIADREGHVCVYMMEGNGTYVLAREHYAPLMEAWQSGRAFYTGTGLLGGPVTIKLSRVEAVADNSAETCARALSEDEAERKERAIRGEE